MTSGKPWIDINGLALGEVLGTGGQGEIIEVHGFVIDNQRPAVLKRYLPAAMSSLRVDALDRATVLPEQLASWNGRWIRENCAWPAHTVHDGGVPCGFLMPSAPADYYFNIRSAGGGSQRKLAELQFLLNSERHLHNYGITVNDGDRLALLRSIAGAFAQLHALNIVVGDFSPKNLLYRLHPPGVFFLDCDGMSLSGTAAIKTAQTPGWECDDGDEPMPASDAYKFGLLAIRLFAGSQSSRDVSAIGEISSELARLAELSQHDKAMRPTPGAWIRPLEMARPAESFGYPRTSTATGSSHGTQSSWAPAPVSPSIPVPQYRPRARGRGLRRFLASAAALVLGVALARYAYVELNKSSVGDACLIGTWRDGGDAFSTDWYGHLVRVSGGAGNIDHISADGSDDDAWGTSAPFYGTYEGKTLKMVERGDHLSKIKATQKDHQLTSTDEGWTSGSYVSYLYDGKTVAGQFSKVNPWGASYSCTATTLKWFSKNSLVDTETRISKTP